MLPANKYLLYLYLFTSIFKKLNSFIFYFHYIYLFIYFSLSLSPLSVNVTAIYIPLCIDFLPYINAYCILLC